MNNTVKACLGIEPDFPLYWMKIKHINNYGDYVVCVPCGKRQEALDIISCHWHKKLKYHSANYKNNLETFIIEVVNG